MNDDVKLLADLVRQVAEQTVTWNATANRPFDFEKVALPEKLKIKVSAIIQLAASTLINEYLVADRELEEYLINNAGCSIELVSVSPDYMQKAIHIGHGRIFYGKSPTFQLVRTK